MFQGYFVYVIIWNNYIINRGEIMSHLQNLIFDNRAFGSHRAMAAILSVILKLPPIKQAMASKQMKSVYLEKLISKINI